MKLSQKSVILFVLITAVPILGIGALFYVQTERTLRERVSDQLVSMAKSQRGRITSVINQNTERMKFITQKAELINGLVEYNAKKSAENSDPYRDKINAVLNDIRVSIADFENIALFDVQGNLITSAKEISKREIDVYKTAFAEGEETINVTTVIKNKPFLTGPILQKGEIIGVVVIKSNANSLNSLVGDYAGLGETGESFVIKRAENEKAVFITPLRFYPLAALEEKEYGLSTFQSLTAQTNELMSGIDYRGEPVVFATWYIKEADWGLVVKIDRKEVFATTTWLINTIPSLIAVIIALSILIGWYLSRSVIKPLSRIVEVADDIKAGRALKRTQIGSNSEISSAAAAFDEIVVRFTESEKTLRQIIKEQTAILEREKVKDEAIIASIGEGVLVVDHNEKVTIINNAAMEMLGLSVEDIIGKNSSEIIQMEDEHNERLLPEKMPIRAVLSSDKPLFSIYQLVKKDMTKFPAAITTSPVLLREEIIGAVVAFRDITKEMDIDRAKTEFVSLAAHQLRTPLSTINWYIEMLQDNDVGTLNSQQGEYLKTIYGSAKHLTELVNTLLDVSRIELGTFTISPQPTDIRTLADSALDELSQQIATRKMNITKRYDENIPLISVDPVLMRIIFQNLLSNAVKYTSPEGSVSMEITKSEPDILITVSDTGYGISKKEYNKIFTKLFRSETMQVKNTQGTGLGLYIVKSVLETGGGKIWFESEEGKGTKFYVSIPLSGMKQKKGLRTLNVSGIN